LNRQKINPAKITPNDRDDPYLSVRERAASETKPTRHEGKADQAAKRQHRHDVDTARQYDLGQHVGNAERGARGNAGTKPAHAIAERGRAHLRKRPAGSAAK
jgi:hypothetical protein